MRIPVYACCVIAFVALVSALSTAQAPPTADAFVTITQPEANFGSSPILPVQAGTNSYVRLNLGVVPAGSTIAKATLRLYVNAVVTPGAFDILQVNEPWSERTISFSRAPQIGPSATGGHPVTINGASQNQFVLIDITSLVQAWLSGAVPNNGIALSLAGTNGSFSFDSKESTGTGHYPELEIVYQHASNGHVTETLAPSAAQSNGLISPPGSSPYIDNGTTLQSGASFHIDGSGTAAILNATSSYQLNGSTVFGPAGGSSFLMGPGAGQNNSGNENLFVGQGAGQNNSTANFGTFIGSQAGQANTTGDFNTFVGRLAGQANTTGTLNSFFGSTAGYQNTTGSNNSFLGTYSGASNTTGSFNNYVGVAAGQLNTTGSNNNFMGASAGQLNTTGSLNNFVGNGAGQNNTTGSYNTFVGANAGNANTTGTYNMYFGGASGVQSTTATANVFVGMNSGFNNTTGSNNVFIGPAAGYNADPAANNNVYLATWGQAGESDTTRIGTAGTQTAAYVAGINGSSTSSGVPVFIDSTGKLGTGGGSVNFTQVTGTVSSPQLTGFYTNQVTLSNTSNVFVGNGAGLTGVTSGTSWPIAKKSANYTVQLSDFSTPSTVGNLIIATGSASLTFMLPSTAPPNGACVGIGNVIDGGINSNMNAYLTVNPNGLTIDATTGYVSTHPRRATYMYCSDGTGYFRFGYEQNGVSEIGPWIKTYDTGIVNVMTSTFRNGMDFGLTDGTLIYLLPKFANTAGIVTLNLNGLGASKILKYGNQALTPGDLSPNSYAHLIWNVNTSSWQLLNPQSQQGLTGTTASLGGSLISAGTCMSGTVAVTGATVGHPVGVSASDGSLPDPLVILSAAVTSVNTVTVQLCAVATVTPTAKTYSVSTQ